MPHIRGIILDVDGTLIDSNDAHAHAWVRALREAGHNVSFEQVRRLVGMGGDNLLPEIAHVEKESAEGKQIAKRYMDVFKSEYLPNLTAFPGTREMVTRMHEAGLRVVIGSSSETEVLDTLLEIANVKDLIDESVSSKDAKNSKPDPDTVVVALEKLNLSPEETLMLGDTPYDISSAAKGGVKTIALRCGGWSDADLHEALAIYDDPMDLVSHFDQSPLVN
jgi:HAD superfamily hydrolase (TIGR01509 family)